MTKKKAIIPPIYRRLPVLDIAAKSKKNILGVPLPYLIVSSLSLFISSLKSYNKNKPNDINIILQQ